MVIIFEIYSPENASGYVRLGAAFNNPGVYSSTDLNLFCGSTSYDLKFRVGNTEEMRIDGADGAIYGKFRHITHHDYHQNNYYCCNRWQWFPKSGSEGFETVDNRSDHGNMWIVPYSGRIVSITIGCSHFNSNGGYEINDAAILFAHHPDLNEAGGCGSGSNFCPVATSDAGKPGQLYLLSGNGVVNNSTGKFSINESPAGTVQWRAEGSNHFSFSKGDRVAVGLNPYWIEDNNYHITIVWEYDIWE